MQKDADEIFRVKDLAMLKSPVPSHLRRAGSSVTSPLNKPAIGLSNLVGTSPLPPMGNTSTNGPSPLLIRPTPKPMAPPPARPKHAPLSAMAKMNYSHGNAPSTPGTVTKTLFPLSMDSTPLAKKSTNLFGSEKPLSLSESNQMDNQIDDHTARHSPPKIENLQSTLLETANDSERAPAEIQIFMDSENTLSEEENVDTKPEKCVLKKNPLNKTSKKPTVQQIEQENISNGNLNGLDQALKAEVEREIEPNNTAVSAIKGPCQTDIKESSVHTSIIPMNNSKEYIMNHWYLQRIPNNPRFSQVERAVCEEWVVLVGFKEGIEELWHSSIVTGRESAKRIVTGSGRIYNITDCDIDAMLKAGFSQEFTDKFAQSFGGSSWKSLLIQELSGEAREAPRSTGKISTIPRTVLKTPQSVKRKKATPKTPTSEKKTPTKVRATKNHTTPLTAEVPRLIGSTRSGRKIITPVPFWDAKTAAEAYNSRQSPSSLRIKRRWGNRVVDLE